MKVLRYIGSPAAIDSLLRRGLREDHRDKIEIAISLPEIMAISGAGFTSIYAKYAAVFIKLR